MSRKTYISDWIPVKERLPEKNGTYLIKVRGINQTGFFDTNTRGWTIHPYTYIEVGVEMRPYYLSSLSTITHWAPIEWPEDL